MPPGWQWYCTCKPGTSNWWTSPGPASHSTDRDRYTEGLSCVCRSPASPHIWAAQTSIDLWSGHSKRLHAETILPLAFVSYVIYEPVAVAVCRPQSTMVSMRPYCMQNHPHWMVQLCSGYLPCTHVWIPGHPFLVLAFLLTENIRWMEINDLDWM